MLAVRADGSEAQHQGDPMWSWVAVSLAAFGSELFWGGEEGVEGQNWVGWPPPLDLSWVRLCGPTKRLSVLAKSQHRLEEPPWPASSLTRGKEMNFPSSKVRLTVAMAPIGCRGSHFVFTASPLALAL